MKHVVCVLVSAGVLLTAACSNSSTSPSSTTTTQTPAAPTATETWNDTVSVGGSRTYAFNVGTYGTVNITMLSVGGAFVPSTVTLGLGLGTPAGTSCSTTSSANAQASSTTPQLTGAYNAGLYCVLVSDLGNLFAPATFSVSIAHP